jgi:hypothetical protein
VKEVEDDERIRVDDLHKEWMKDYTHRREYEALEEEFSGVAALIDARNRSVLEE